MARRRQQVEEEIVEETEDELEELEEVEEEAEEEGEEAEEETEDDDLEELEEVEEEEVEEQPKSRKAKAAAKKAAAPKKATPDGHNSAWLAEHVSQTTGKDVDSRQLRMILRKLASEGDLERAVGEDRTRYTFSGPNDPIVKKVVTAVKAGATERKASNVDNLAKAREAKAAKKQAAAAPAKKTTAKAAPAKKAATKTAAPAKATKATRRRSS